MSEILIDAVKRETPESETVKLQGLTPVETLFVNECLCQNLY